MDLQVTRPAPYFKPSAGLPLLRTSRRVAPLCISDFDIEVEEHHSRRLRLLGLSYTYPVHRKDSASSKHLSKALSEHAMPFIADLMSPLPPNNTNCTQETLNFKISKTRGDHAHNKLAIVSEIIKADGPAEQCTGSAVKAGALENMAEALIANDEKNDSLPLSTSPSPPESSCDTPRLSLLPCPARLTSYVPPVNYGTVQRNMMFRSGFPHDRNLEFVNSLRLKAVLTLVDTDPSPAYADWIVDSQITHRRITLAPNKTGAITTTLSTLCEAILFALDPAHHPLYIHCNQGRHRTGCVVACIRKVQQWPLADVLAEYDAYASPKARPGDIALIEAFDPLCLKHHITAAATADQGWSTTAEAARSVSPPVQLNPPAWLKNLRTTCGLDIYADDAIACERVESMVSLQATTSPALMMTV